MKNLLKNTMKSIAAGIVLPLVTFLRVIVAALSVIVDLLRLLVDIMATTLYNAETELRCWLDSLNLMKL